MRMELDLTDGSHIIGVPGIEVVPVETPYAKMDIPLREILTLTIGEDRETATLEMRNGDRLKGVVTLKAIPLETAFGKVTVGMELIGGIEVVLPETESTSHEPDGTAALESADARKPLPRRGQPGAACSVLSLGVHDGTTRKEQRRSRGRPAREAAPLREEDEAREVKKAGGRNVIYDGRK
jgi:hypothetical protein